MARENKTKQWGKRPGKKTNMAYKKPQLVAKSAPKQSYVAGCPLKSCSSSCYSQNTSCMCGPLK